MFLWAKNFKKHWNPLCLTFEIYFHPRNPFYTSCIIALKELKSCILRIIHVWSLFCSIWVYTSLYILLVLLENWVFPFLYFLCFLSVLCFLPVLDVIFVNFYNICIINVYMVGVIYSVLFSLNRNDLSK